MSVKTYSFKNDGNKKLSDHFTVSEFRCKDGSDKILIDTDLVDILQKIRNHFGKPITINSAYRNATYNKKIGGASKSQHVVGTAADIVVQGVKPELVAQYAEYLMPNKGGIGLYSTFTHVDVRANRSRWKNNGKEFTVSGFPGYKETATTTKVETVKTSGALKVFIDAGHNDSKWDTGAEGNGLKEQDITFAVSKKLSDMLQAVGVSTKLSRAKKTDVLGTDMNTSLSARSKMANDWGADIYISIHCNAFGNTSAHGTEVYTYNTSSKIYSLAQNICSAICNGLGTFKRGTKTASYAVLKNTNMPAMLIELAFITNPSDAQLLKNKQDDFAKAIFNEICKNYNIKKVLETTADIVNDLASRGIITNKQLWTSKCAPNSNAYWLAYKGANMTTNKTAKTNLTTVNDIVWELSERNIMTDKVLWMKLLEEDKDLYWLAFKICNYTKNK